MLSSGVILPEGRQKPAVAVAHVLTDMIDAVAAAMPGDGGRAAEEAALHDDMVDWEAVRTAQMEYVRPYQPACPALRTQSLGLRIVGRTKAVR